jgi:hypothetical protein
LYEAKQSHWTSLAALLLISDHKINNNNNGRNLGEEEQPTGATAEVGEG